MTLARSPTLRNVTGVTRAPSVTLVVWAASQASAV